MTDPEHGVMPSKIGAPAKKPSETTAEGGADGGRFGSEFAPHVGPNGQGDGGSRQAVPRQAEFSADGTEDSRRRKRRRSRRGKGKAASAAAQAGREPAPDEQDKAPASGSRHGKGRNRKRRAFQGRPLVAEDRPAPSAATPPAASQGTSRPGTAEAIVSAAPAAGSVRPGQAAARAPRSDETEADPFYAALDLGTNNCRLLVAQPTRPGQFRVVDAFSRIVRLGEGMIASGRLSDAAMDRAVEALRVCAAKLRNRSIRKMRLIATEACRAAENGAEFLTRVKSETGLDLEVVDRETEARLAVSGCASLVERDARSVVLFDIGGGSSEIAVIELAANRTNRLANHIKAWTSLPVGVVTLSEQHGGREVTRDIFAAMIRDVEVMLARFECPGSLTGHHIEGGAGFHLLGTSGTVTTLAGIHLDLPRYDRRRVDGLWLTSADVDLMLERLLSWNFDQRSANPCIGADRADLVLAGCAILEAIRRRWPAERMRVADRGLREGLLTEMMAADGVWRRPRRGRRGHWHASARGAG